MKTRTVELSMKTRTAKKPNSYILVHCFIESNKGKKLDVYEISIKIGRDFFSIDADWTGKRAAMGAARKLSKVTGLDIYSE